jgi:hypothetical protein
VVWWSGDDVL